MNLFDIAQTNKIEPAPAVEPAVEPTPHQEEVKTPVAIVQKSPRRRRRRRRRRRKTELKPSSNVDVPNKEKSQEEPLKEHKHEQKRGRKKNESTKIEELQSQMATQSAQITSLLGQVAEMLAQSKTTKGAERQRVETALEEQRVLNQIGSRKGVLNYVQTTYLGLAGRFPPNPSKYPDMGTRAKIHQQISK